MYPALETVAEYLAHSSASKPYATDLEKWLSLDWPNALTRLGELVPSALSWQSVEGQLATLSAQQHELDRTPRHNLRQRVRLQDAMARTVRSLTQAFDEHASDGR